MPLLLPHHIIGIYTSYEYDNIRITSHVFVLAVNTSCTHPVTSICTYSSAYNMNMNCGWQHQCWRLTLLQRLITQAHSMLVDGTLSTKRISHQVKHSSMNNGMSLGYCPILALGLVINIKESLNLNSILVMNSIFVILPLFL